MISKQRLFMVLSALASSALLAAGCSGSDSAQQITADACGPGTQLESGKCVLATSGCGAGTTLDADSGACVPAEEACSTGSTYDQATKLCVANSDVLCGDGTAANAEGVCMPSAQACAAGTTLDDQNRCVLAPAACADGTQLDAVSGECTLSDTVCGDGLALAGGHCVATDEVCGENASFHQDLGLCVGDLSCRSGDVVLNNVCVTPADKLASESDVTVGDDITEVTAKPVGERLVFTGTIDAPVEVDGEREQALGVIQFSGTAGQWFKVSVQSLGLLAPSFIIEGPEDTTPIYRRWGSVGVESDPVRYIVLPHDGDYTITVLPSLLYATSPLGDASWDYVGYLEQLDAPETTEVELDVDGLSFSGDIKNLTENVYEITNATPNELISFTVNSLRSNVTASVLAWEDATTLAGAYEGIQRGETVSIAVPESGNLTLVIDWRWISDPDTSFSATARPSGFAQDIVLDAQDTQTVTGHAPANAVLSVYYTGLEDPDSLAVTVRDADGNTLASKANLLWGEPLYAFYPSGGEFSVELVSDLSIAANIGVFVEFVTPTDVGTVPVDSEVVVQDLDVTEINSPFLLVNTIAGEVLEFSSSATVYLTLYNSEGEVVHNGVSLSSATRRFAYSAHGGAMLVQLSQYFWDETGVELTISSSTPVHDAGTLSAGDDLEFTQEDEVSEGERQWIRFTTTEDLMLSGELSAAEGSTQLHVFSQAMRQVLHLGTSAAKTFDGVNLTPSTYLVAVTAQSELLAGYTLTAALNEGYATLVESGTNTSKATADEIDVVPSILMGSSDESDDEDLSFWSFTVSAPKLLVFNAKITTGTVSWLSMFITDEDGTSIVSRPMGSGQTGTIGAVFQPGKTYYLQVGGDGTFGSYPYEYEILVSEFTSNAVAEVEPNDTMGEALDLGVLDPDGLAAVGTVVGVESDYFAFEVTDSADVSITVEKAGALATPAGTSAVLYNSQSDVITLDSDTATLDPGTYYVKVARDTASVTANTYLLSISLL